MNHFDLNDIPPIIDFEASSLSDTSYPISAGLVFKGRVYHWIIKPEPDWIDWSLESQAIHGMSRSFVESNGLPAPQVHAEILKLLGDEPAVYSDNPLWEKLWFSRLGKAPFQFLDIVTLLDESYKLIFSSERKSTMANQKLTPHRADHDALSIALTLTRLTAS